HNSIFILKLMIFQHINVSFNIKTHLKECVSICIFVKNLTMTSTFKVIAFDADDTLFINEPYFDEAEEKFCALMSDYLSKQSLAQALFKTQISNLPLYGYGIKGYVLSMVQTAYEVSNHTVSTKVMEKIIEIGKELLAKPIVLLDGIEDTLQQLHGKYKLVVATKGDLKD